MSRRVSFTLTDDQLGQIVQAINYSPQAEVRQRAIAIRLLHLGYKPDQVADMVVSTAHTIWTWHRRFRQDGVAGLADKLKPGRKTMADEAYLRQLDEALNSDPQQVGLPFTVWTIDRLRLYLHQQTGVLLSYSRFRALLSKQGYVWRQPKHERSARQDAKGRAAARQFVDWLKTRPASGSSRPASVAAWTKRG